MSGPRQDQDFAHQDLGLEAVEIRAHRHEAQDGLTEFLAGTMFFFIARVVGEPHLTWVLGLLVFPMRWAYRFFKTRFTYPRVGYVKLKSEKAGEFGGGVLMYLAGVLFVLAAGLWVFGDITSWRHWARWMPGLTGAFTAGGFFALARNTALGRHYALAGLSLGWGIVCSLTPFDSVYLAIQRWALGLGLACLLTGVSVFWMFLRKHPVRSGDQQPEGAHE